MVSDTMKGRVVAPKSLHMEFREHHRLTFAGVLCVVVLFYFLCSRVICIHKLENH